MWIWEFRLRDLRVYPPGMIIIDLDNPDACDNILLHAHSWNSPCTANEEKPLKIMYRAAQLQGMNCNPPDATATFSVGQVGQIG